MPPIERAVDVPEKPCVEFWSWELLRKSPWEYVMWDRKHDISEIEDGLFLSNRGVAQAEKVLASIGISHVLTVDTWPIRTHLFTKPEDYVFHYLKKDDEEHVDLLSHFEECNGFISSGRKVLVHCYVGRSRSATIVLAFLMNKYRIPYEEALDRVRAKRPIAPNDGFVDQLKLYERMGFEIKKEIPSFQLFALASTAGEVGSNNGLDKVPDEVREKVISLLIDAELDIFCRHCRCPLTTSKCILPHLRGKRLTWRTLQNSEAGSVNPQDDHDCGEMSMLPNGKIVAQCRGLAGKIYCPKCTNKIGRFNWLGLNCDCGCYMQPGFVLSTTKIDRKLANFILPMP